MTHHRLLSSYASQNNQLFKVEKFDSFFKSYQGESDPEIARLSVHLQAFAVLAQVLLQSPSWTD